MKPESPVFYPWFISAREMEDLVARSVQSILEKERGQTATITIRELLTEARCLRRNVPERLVRKTWVNFLPVHVKANGCTWTLAKIEMRDKRYRAIYRKIKPKGGKR